MMQDDVLSQFFSETFLGVPLSWFGLAGLFIGAVGMGLTYIRWRQGHAS